MLDLLADDFKKAGYKQREREIKIKKIKSI